MLTLSPFSLFCAILLSLPLALVFTITSDSITPTTLSFSHTQVVVIPHTPPPPTPSPPPQPLPLPPRKLYIKHHWSSPEISTHLISTTSPPPPKVITKLPTTITKTNFNPNINTTLTPPPSKVITKPPRTPKNISNPIVNTTSSSPPPPPPPRGIKKPSKTIPKKSKNPKVSGTFTNASRRPPVAPPPPLPEDDKDDVQLLNRASKVNTVPTGGPKKVAFMFLTTTPLPFAPVWEKFFMQTGAEGKYNVYIHNDPRMKYNPPFTGVFSGRVIPISKPTRRNTPTLVAAARRLLAYALLDDPDNYMFTLISAACIPIHSFNFTYHTLTSSNKSFIEVLSNETTAYGRWTARGERVMLPEVPFEVFRIGSQFWSLKRIHARVVVEDVKLWRKFRLPCITLSTCFPDENYFPTLISMVDPDGVVPTTLTSVNWEGSYNGHPRTYNGSEVGPGLIQWLRETRPRYGDEGININGSDMEVSKRWDPFLFARKFTPNCVQPLLKLADDVLFKD